MRHSYIFCVSLDEARAKTSGLVDLFRLFRHKRMEMSFSEDEFACFRSDLADCGIRLVAIERRPHAEPEAVP